MRIIAGLRRGLKLLPPKTDGTRPITDRVKESLFNVLWNTYGLPEDKYVADVFCGTGSLGIEAVSRGAKFCLFVESNPKAIEVLNKNLERAQFVAQSKVIRTNAFKVGAPVGFDQPKNDLVFVDPPYKLSQNVEAASPLGKMLGVISEQVSPEGFVIVRTDDRVEIMNQYARLSVIDRRNWGTMNVVILQKQMP